MIEQFENKIINADCLDILKQLPDKCIDLVLTDPPYGYTNTEFDKIYFDEVSVFNEIKRVIKDEGFVVFSGRGDTFYKWNLICNGLNIPFREEIVWNKNGNSNPLGDVKRIHELISIRGKGNFNKVKINFINECLFNNEEFRILETIKRIKTEIKDHKKEFLQYIETGKIEYLEEKKQGFGISCSRKTKEANRGLSDFKKITDGASIKSIISVSRDSVYKNIHPTQKPVELFEKILELCSQKEDVVLDCFSGSGTTAVACHNLKRKFICVEKDFDYWKASCKRLEDHQRQGVLF